jgi:uncharacterized protein (TIGR03067 family)
MAVYDAQAMHATSFRAGHSPIGLLDGTWLVTAGQLGGVRLPDNAFDDLTLTLRNGRFELGQDRGRVGLDCCVTPAALDVLIIDGPNRGRFVPAIVERAGGMLRVCYDLGGTQRPATFGAPAGTRYFLATYRRASEPRARPRQVALTPTSGNA